MNKREQQLFCPYCQVETLHGKEKVHYGPEYWLWAWRCYVCGRINKMFK